MKQRKIMFGNETITIIYLGLEATIDIFNRKTKESAYFEIDSNGILKERTNIKINLRGLYKALCYYDKYRYEVFA